MFLVFVFDEQVSHIKQNTNMFNPLTRLLPYGYSYKASCGRPG